MCNVGLDDSQAGINNFIYANDNTLMAESEERQTILLIEVKDESEKAGLKLNIQRTKIMVSGLISSCQIDGEIGRLCHQCAS